MSVVPERASAVARPPLAPRPGDVRPMSSAPQRAHAAARPLQRPRPRDVPPMSAVPERAYAVARPPRAPRPRDLSPMSAAPERSSAAVSPPRIPRRRSGRPTSVSQAHGRAVAPRSLLAAALARAGAWLLEPADAPDVAGGGAPSAVPEPPHPGGRPTIVVTGAARGCGATTIARALAAELAGRDSSRTAVVAGASARGALPLGTPAAARVARLLAAGAGIDARASGRLCLVEPYDHSRLERAARGIAPLVFDAEPGAAAGGPASLADGVVVVATPAIEPALAALVAESLGRVGPEPLIALTRADDDRLTPTAWSGRANLVLPESRPAARMALAGRGAAGSFGAEIAALADLYAAR